MLITRRLIIPSVRILALALPLVGGAYSQAVIQHGTAIAAGSAVGTAAGKSASDALTRAMNAAGAASKTGDTQVEAKPAEKATPAAKPASMPAAPASTPTPVAKGSAPAGPAKSGAAPSKTEATKAEAVPAKPAAQAVSSAKPSSLPEAVPAKYAKQVVKDAAKPDPAAKNAKDAPPKDASKAAAKEPKELKPIKVAAKEVKEPALVASATSTVSPITGKAISAVHKVKTQPVAAAPAAELVETLPAEPTLETPLAMQLALADIHPVLQPLAERLQRIIPGNSREDLKRILGAPASRVTIPSDRDVSEIYYYQSKGRNVGIVRLEAGSVTKVSID